MKLIDAPNAARAAAIWWAEQVGAPVYLNTGPTSSPEERQMGDLAAMGAYLLAERRPVTQQASSQFVELLEQRVAEDLNRNPQWVSLSTDYGPDWPLAEIAEQAGVPLSRFPWKMHMSIAATHVTAALGYGRRHVLVWHAPDWERPACAENRWDDEPRDEICPKPRYHEEPCGDWEPDTRRCVNCGGPFSAHYSGDRAKRPCSSLDWKPGGAA